MSSPRRQSLSTGSDIVPNGPVDPLAGNRRTSPSRRYRVCQRHQLRCVLAHGTNDGDVHTLKDHVNT